MNTVCIIGRLVRDPELRQTSTNKAVVSFTIANDYGKSADGAKKTAFIDCYAWRNEAEFINKYFVKGDPIEVVGTLTTRTWEKDGRKNKATEVEVLRAGFAMTQKQKERTDDDPARPGEFSELAEDDGELPF